MPSLEPASWDLSQEAAEEVRRTDPDLARRRGVHATPPALTGFVVRSVHHLLQQRFGLAAGLACSSVRLLDPAAGPANFLLEAWRVAVAEHRLRHGEDGVAALLQGHLLPHSLGIELLPQPVALGRLAAERFLAAHGLKTGRGRRLALRQADALAAPPPFAPEPGTVAVVLGNPPFTGGLAEPGWASRLTTAWRPAGERCVRWLQGDAVRFLALAEWVVRRHGAGIAALVLPHSVLAAPSFRELRRHLLATFPDLWALDLHGNMRQRERAPGGGADENLFDGVAQGVAVVLAVRTSPGAEPQDGTVRVFDLWGSRAQKLAALAGSDVSSLAWAEALPAPHGFVLRRRERALDRTYRCGLPLPDLFPQRSTGIVTGGDAALIGLDRGLGEERLGALRQQGRSLQPGDLTPFLVRPFDLRHLIYAPTLLARPRSGMGNLLRRGGLALLATRGGVGAPAVFATRWLAGHKVASPHEVNAVFPLFLGPAAAGPGGAQANLRPGLVDVLGRLYGSRPLPLAVFAYVYALLHSPAYRSRNRDALAEDFPRVPFPLRSGPFLALSEAGVTLLRLHLLVNPHLRQPPVLPPTGVAGLCPAVRSYQIGGVPVLDRWLRARGGRPLSWMDRINLARIAEALRRSLAAEATLDRPFLEVAAAPALLAEAA